MTFKREKLNAVLAGLLGLSVAFHSPHLGADEVDDVCGKTLNTPTATITQNGATQKLQYCQAAKSAQDGSDADNAMWKVWAAVGTVCTYACIASFAGGPTSEYLCMGASLGGGITDGIVTKNFAGALMSIAGVGTGYAINYAVNKTGSETAKAGAKEVPKKEKDIGACINAGMAAIQVYSKFKSMQGEDDSVHGNLDSAKKIVDTTTPAADGSGGFSAQQLAAQTAADASGGTTGAVGGTLASSNGSSSTSSNCAQAKSTSNPTLIMQCAISSDRNLPGFVQDPRFAKEFQKDSGQNLGDFLNKNDKPGALMASAMGNGMNQAQGSKLATALNEVDQNTRASHDSGDSGAMYAGGGGGGAGAGAEDPMAGMSDMIAGMMDKMNPKKGKDEKNTGVNAVVFANRTRSPASVVEDKTLNIFDRVTYRYLFVSRRLGAGEISK